MTVREIDKVLGRPIRIRFPFGPDGIVTLVRRRPRSRVVESLQGHVFEGADLELVEVLPAPPADPS